METEVKQTNNILIPASIVVAGALIALAVFMNGNKGITTEVAKAPVAQVAPTQEEALAKIRAVTTDDHIRGNIDAPIKIVEYSDTECPFCKRFHATMQQVMNEYGPSDRVAWVYRHFPLDQLHPIKARNEATGFECANEQGGNDKFWAYADRLYEITPSNNGLDPAELPKIAEYVGLDVAKFNTCLASNKFAQHIEDDAQNAVDTGGRGTPWSIVIAKNGKKYPINGAKPYEIIKQLIDSVLQER